MKEHISTALTYIQSTLSILFAIGCIGWIILIGEGTYVNGHIPTYGDIETISFDGWDRSFVGYSLSLMFFGGAFWLTLTLINLKLKLIRQQKAIFAIGLTSLILNSIILFSPCTVWALD
jgi:hypothetical protein